MTSQAFECFFLQQNPSALNALGWYALNHERNYTKAAKYLEQAYAAGNPDAAYQLGAMHFHGSYPGQKKDRVRCMAFSFTFCRCCSY